MNNSETKGGQVVAYMRVGSQEQLASPRIRIGVYIRATDEYSLAVQKVYYEKRFADTEKYLVNYFIDTGKKARITKDRVGFLKIMQECRQHNLDEFHTKSIERVSRDRNEIILWIEEMRMLGIPAVCEHQCLNTATDEAYYDFLSRHSTDQGCVKS